MPGSATVAGAEGNHVSGQPSSRTGRSLGRVQFVGFSPSFVLLERTIFVPHWTIGFLWSAVARHRFLFPASLSVPGWSKPLAGQRIPPDLPPEATHRPASQKESGDKAPHSKDAPAGGPKRKQRR
jgi:hypothetical protein